MTDYAAATTVPVERTRAEIEKLVLSNGAGQFFSAIDAVTTSAIIGWTMAGRQVRLAVVLPNPTAPEFVHPTYRGNLVKYRRRTLEQQRQLWEQACRTRWRALLLIVKAKFEAIKAGISTFEREFLADMLMPDGQTVGAWAAPQLETMYTTGRMPALLPAMGETSR